MRLQNNKSSLYDFVFYLRDVLFEVSGVVPDVNGIKRAIERADIDSVLGEYDLSFLVAYFNDNSLYFDTDVVYLVSYCESYYMSNVDRVYDLVEMTGVDYSVDDYELIAVLLLIEILDNVYGLGFYDLSHEFGF